MIVATGARANYLGLPNRKTASRTGASAPAPSATGPCRASATSRWWWSAAATRRWKRPTISPSSPARSTWSIAATQLRASKIMAQRAHGQSEDRDHVEPRRRRSAGRRQGGRHRRAAQEHGRQAAARRRRRPACSWPSATRPTRTSSKASWRLTAKKYIKWTDAVPHEHQRRRRFRRRRRGRRLLPPGGHRRRHRLHGGARRRTLAGGQGDLRIINARWRTAVVRRDRHYSRSRPSHSVR